MSVTPGREPVSYRARRCIGALFTRPTHYPSVDTTLPEPVDRGRVDADGTEIAYLRAGAGDPLVVAHGYTDDAACRAPLVNALADEWDVVAYDARGHGRSGAPAEGYGIDGRVADLRAVVEGLALDDPVLVGHSMGGNTVAHAVARGLDARAAVLVDPAGLLDDVATGEAAADEMRRQVAAWAAADRETVVAEYADEPVPRLLADARRRLDPAVAGVRAAGYPAFADAAPDIDLPTLVLRADVDGETRARDRAAVGRLADGRVVFVDGAGHTVFRDRFDAALAELTAFLAEL